MAYSSYQDIYDFYNRVRSLLKINDTSFLPDDSIDQYENAPYAEKIVQKKVTKYNELDDDKTLLFESAVVYNTAIQCYSRVDIRSILIQQNINMKIQFEESKFNLFNSLMNNYNNILDELLNPNSNKLNSYFIVTHGIKKDEWY